MGGGVLELRQEAVPIGPFRLPRRTGMDGMLRRRADVLERLLHHGDEPVLVRIAQPHADRVLLGARAATSEAALYGIERMRFALGVDDDLGEFYRRFRRDPLLGPLLRRRPYLRPRRRPWPWEALAWAVVKQLIETGRAARIQRRMVGRWGPRLGDGRDGLRDVPTPDLIAGRAPVELESMGLALRRAIALRAIAADIAGGRCDPAEPAADRRLLSVREIGPWTVQCLGLFGRGDPDSLPAGDLMYLKLVGRLARLGRRATVEEVEEFYAPYEPFRGLAAAWTTGAI